MKDRIRQVMEAQRMTQQDFADFIEISPGSLSSIFNERTRPTLNIVEAIKKKIPTVNTDWLLFGTGEMYLPAGQPADGTAEANKIHPTEQAFNFEQPSAGSLFAPSVGQGPMQGSQMQPSASPQHYGVRATPQNYASESVKNVDKTARKVVEIRVYYDDQTWESFLPSKSK